ncbi:MAG TPA: TonB-dependent receptor plug domain-containing protein, partial [Puia sp.]|nr:TonB-dependent receptor plug domain-containing protein [Puia sp.]
MRKILFVTTVLSLIVLSGFAQPPAGKRNGPPPSIGRAFGKVTDSASVPLQVTVIVLKQVNDSVTKKKKLILLKGMDTKAGGEFNFEDIPIVTQLVLRVSAAGYKSKDVSFMITPSGGAAGSMPSFEKDLGSVILQQAVKEMSSVTVIAQAPAMKLELDKKVFNVERNIVSAGGTALDIMRSVPSVNVDIDGNVTLRGNAPTIYVDGRPTTLTLDEIPADAIQSVEVMTNPSAKYDASATGGILNIILKKNRKEGYNGNISAGIDSHGAPNGLASFNVRQNKINFTGTFLINENKGHTTGNTNRLTTLSPDTATKLLESDLTKNGGGFLFGQVGADYFVTNRTTISASYIRVHGSIKPTETSGLQSDSIFNGVSGQSFYSTRYSNSNLAVDVNGVNAGLKHNFTKDGETLTADGSFFGANATSVANYLTNYYEALP